MRARYLATVALAAVLATPCWASPSIVLNPSPLVGQQVSFAGGVASGINGWNAGAYSATLYGLNGNPNQNWRTFCVETQETIHLNTNYTVFSVTDSEVQASGNTVTEAAKWVYYQWGNQGLDSILTGDYLTTANQKAVQQALWSLTEDSLNNPLVTDGQMNTLAKAIRDAAVAAVAAGPPGINAWDFVQVLNPKLGGTHKQSVLFFDQTSFELSQVPEPFSLGIWAGLGVCGLAFRRRRR